MSHPASAPTVDLVLVAAGSGSRAPGALPKQWRPLGGRPLLLHSLERLAAWPRLRRRLLVLDAASLADPARLAALEGLGAGAPERVEGGPSRQESVARALRALEADPPALVAIHDAARPFLPLDPLERAVHLAAEQGGAVLGAPLVDTLKRADAGGRVLETLPREGLWSVQTPQVFRYPELCRAFEQARDHLDRFTDDASIFEAAGGHVQLVPAPSDNFKLTLPEDFERAEALLRGRAQLQNRE